VAPPITCIWKSLNMWPDCALGSGKARHLGHLGRRHLALRLEQHFDDRIVKRKPRRAFRRRKDKAAGVVERIAGCGKEAKNAALDTIGVRR